MGKVHPKDRETRNAKQKKRLKSTNNRYLRPAGLAQVKHNKASAAKSDTYTGKKTTDVVDFEKSKDDAGEDELIDQSPVLFLTPVRFGFGSPLDKSLAVFSPTEHVAVPFLGSPDVFKQSNWLNTPKRLCGNCDGEYGSESRLESLPMDLLVKIMCHLHHDQLRAVFHVSRKIRKAVIQARQFHFDFTTPDRARQELLRVTTPKPTDHWPFLSKRIDKHMCLWSPHTPKAPKHGPRPPSRIKITEIRHIAANLFKDPPIPSSSLVSSVVLKRPICSKSMGSNRVLFCEDELCHAVAQNKLN